jgi:hypothetical protein
MEQPHGIAVIINIKHFEDIIDGELELNQRDGSDSDVDNLEHMWTEFGFTVRINVKSTTRDQIYAFLSQVKSEINTNQDSSCFVCCIMTRGNMGKIYGSDSKSLDIKDVTDLFKKDNCPALAGKPKLFFIQACRELRGQAEKVKDSEVALEEAEKVKDSEVESGEAVETLDSAAAVSHANYERKNNLDFLERANPNEINFLTGYSTVPGKRLPAFN